MRLRSAELVPYALAFREPYVTATGRLEQRELLLLRLHGDDGLVGLGETTALSLRGGAPLEAIRRQLDELCSAVLVGADLDRPEAVHSLLSACSQLGASPPALCAVDLALRDLLAKERGEPLWAALGATEPAPVECNATLSAGEPAVVAAHAEGCWQEGFRTLKLKIGRGIDPGTVAAVRGAIGAGARLRIDANGTWSVEEAISELRALESQRIELAEQPAAGLEDLRLVRSRTAIPIAADESVVSAADAQRAAELGACDLATVKLAKCGGIGAAMTIAEAVPTYLSSALEGPVGIAAAGHLAIALRSRQRDVGVAHGLATQLLFAQTVAASGPELSDGALHLPPGAGLGVEIDERALDMYRLRG